MHVRWRPRARDDLLDIFLFIARSGAPQTALTYADRVEAFANAIGDLPYAGRSREDLGPGLRTRPFRSVVVVYDISEGEVRILRIVHAARNYERMIRDDDSASRKPPR